MKYFILLLILTVSSTEAQPDTTVWKPVDYSRWINKSDHRKQAALFGEPIRNYERTDGDWETIDNNWINSGDSLYTAHNAVLKTEVRKDGSSQITFSYQGESFIIRQTLRRMVWLRSADWAWDDIFTQPDWSTVAVDSNIISWRNVFPQIDYRIIKTNGKLEHRIYFNPSFLDTAVALYDQSADTSSLYLANVIEYSFSQNIDNADLELGNRERRILKQFGRMTFTVDHQQLFYPGWNSSAYVPVLQRWIKQNGKIYCIEAVAMTYIKAIHRQYPDSSISHNDSQTFDENSCEDTFVNSQMSTNNYGIYSNYLRLTVGGYGGFRKFDLSGIFGSVHVDSTRLKIVFNNTQDSCKLGFMTTDWDEGNVNAGAVDAVGEHGATWEKAKDTLGTSGDWSWSSSSFSSADYNDNNGNGYGKVLAGSGSYFGYLSEGDESTGSNSKLISDWINGAHPNYGYVYIEYDASAGSFRPREFAPQGYQPSLYIEWTDLSNGNSSIRRRKLLMKGKHR